MDITAHARYVRISPRKAISLARAIQGLPVAAALQITQFSERKAAFLIGKAIKSAVANAENNAKLSAESLTVKEAIVNPGPTMRRHWARARGSASPIRKRTSHIKITLTDAKPPRKR